ncbi:hypothetical protein FACS1894159_01610 [Bacteroidia bacterium]|nr:hypothetical protein FACS1894159_01610 [Bacteroidia bacterium]
MKKFKLFLLALSSVFLAAACTQREDLSDGDAAFYVTPSTQFVLGCLEQDTTINLVIRSSKEWTASSDSPWSDLSVHNGGANTSVRLHVDHNGGTDLRSALISFDLGRGLVRTIGVKQLGSGDILEVDGSLSRQLDYTAQQMELTVYSNIDLSCEFTSGGEYFNCQTTKEGDFTHKITISCPQNNDVFTHDATFLITGSGPKGVQQKTIAISQMYYVETLSGNVRNDNSGIAIQWSAASSAAIGYYELQITDNMLNALTSPIDVTSEASMAQPEYDIAGLAAFQNAITSATPNYMGEVVVKVIAKSDASSQTILAMTQAIGAHSHFLSGAGTETDPYRIDCARHLNNIGALWVKNGPRLSSANFLQTKNIVLDDPAGVNTASGQLGQNMNIIANSANLFNGTYDGAGHQIGNVYISSDDALVGPFAQIGPDGTVCRLTVEVNRIQGDGTPKTANTDFQTTNIGGIAALNQGVITGCKVVAKNAASVIYCPNNGAKTNSGAIYNGYVGGICGGQEGKVEYCSNSCQIVSLNVGGGIFGGINSTITAKGSVSYCYNTADIFGGYPGAGVTVPGGIVIPSSGTMTSNQTVGAASGGICGRVEFNGTAANVYLIRKCFNSGNIYGDCLLGGVAGRVNIVEIGNCYNSGNVTQSRNGNNTYSGGVVGHFNSGNAAAKLINCYNAGVIQSARGIDFTGLIAGIKNGVNSAFIDVVACGNTGDTPVLIYGATTSVANQANITGKVLSSPALMQSLANYYPSYGSDIWAEASSLASNPSGYLYPQLTELPHVNRTTY